MSVPIVDNLTVNGIATLNGSNGLLTLNNTAGDYYQLNFANAGTSVWQLGPNFATNDNLLFYSNDSGSNLLNIDSNTGMLLINDSNLGEKINMYNTSTGYSIGVESNNFKFVMGSGVSDRITFNKGPYGSSTEVMHVQSDGIVRIGDQSVNTTGQLVVGQEQGGYVGGGNHRAQFVATGTQTPIVAIGGSGSVEIWKDSTPSKASAFGGTVPGNPISDDFVFSKWNGSSWAETMRILNTNGNIGINVQAPAEKLTVSGNISASGTLNTFSLSSRTIDLVHSPANDGTNPVLRIGEYDTTSGNAGFSGMFMSYNEVTNTFGISAQFAPAAGIPAISINRNAVVGARTLVAGPAFDSFSASAAISAMSGMYVEPVSGYAGFYTSNPVAPVDIRGSTKIIGFSAFGNTPTCLRMRDDYLYVLCTGNNTLNVFDTSTSVPQFVASAATYALGFYSTLAIQGKYAFVTTTAGIQSFDISATTPVSAGIVAAQSYLTTNYNQPGQIMVQGRHAYATYYNASFPNSSVYNIVDISDPAKLSHLILPTNNTLGGNANFTIQGTNFYYGYSFVGGNGLYQGNLAANPVPTSSQLTQIQNGTVSSPIGLAAQGRYVYYSGPTALYVLDTTRSGTSRIVATRALDNMSGTFYMDIVIQRQYAYVLRATGIYVIDISNPLNPVVVQRLSINVSGTTYRGMVVRGRYLYFTDGTNAAIYRVDLGGSYVQQLEAGGIHTEHMYSSNVYAANEIAAIGGGSFGGGLNVQGNANVQGALRVTPQTTSQATYSSYFSVVSSNTTTGSTVFAVTNLNRVGIGTAIPDTTLTVVGDVSASGNITAGGALTVTNAANVSGVVTLGNSSTNPTLQFIGYANKGGTGYHDFALVTNTYSSATNPNKYFRLNSTGGLEIINSNYSANLLQITNDGAINVYGAAAAVVSNNDALSGYIGFGNNNTQIFDDGNTHFHARGSGNGIWVNTNNAQLNLLTQSPVNGGSVGTGIAIGTTTLNGYVSINSSRTTAITQPYGYLNSSGAGTTAGTSPNPYSLTCSSRIQSPEFNASSDERLKENIVPISLKDATNFVKGVSAVTFNWKDPENPGKKSGYIAQQVMRAGFDHLISIVGNASVQEKIDADGFVSPASAALVMNYDQAIPYHSTIIKNLLERIEQLEAEVNRLSHK